MPRPFRLPRTGLLLGLLSAAAAWAQPLPSWRVCLPDVAVPPYLSADPARPGLIERRLVDAGRRAGLDVRLERMPSRRCIAQLERGQFEASIAAPIPANLARFLFPLQQGQPDDTRRLARVKLVWVKRRDSALDWDGRQLSGASSAPLVGTRLGMGVLAESVRDLGLPLDDAALSTPQLLAKLSAGRVELVLALEHEVAPLLAGPGHADLVMLARPRQASSFYPVLRRSLKAPQLAQAQAWWAEIARLRELPDYRLPDTRSGGAPPASGRGSSSTR